MPTWTDIRADINAQITANGANAITGPVLNAILLAVCDLSEQENGDLTSLNTTAKTNLVGAINEVLASATPGLEVLSGTTDPNVSPPASFNEGDFYKQVTGGGAFVAWWQYDGNVWINQVDKFVAQNDSTISIKGASHTVLKGEKTIIYTGSNPADIITIGTPADNLNRVVEIINQHSANINFSTTYKDYTGADVTTIALQAKTVIKSDGTNWYLV